LSVSDWYNQQPFDGSPKSIQIDGFDAIQDGRTIYVSAINDTLEPDPPAPAPSPATIYKNIYLISMNNNAHEDSVNIYNQLVENWRFLVNIVNEDDRAKLRRDLQRVDDAYYMANILENREFPAKLESGSFKKGVSVSTWPSWVDSLSRDLGVPLPVDPVNKISCDVQYQPTCRNDITKDLQCWGDFADGSKSTFYKYKYLESANQTILQINLEYGASAKWSNIFIGGGWNFITGTNCSNLEYIKNY